MSNNQIKTAHSDENARNIAELLDRGDTLKELQQAGVSPQSIKVHIIKEIV